MSHSVAYGLTAPAKRVLSRASNASSNSVSSVEVVSLLLNESNPIISMVVSKHSYDKISKVSKIEFDISLPAFKQRCYDVRKLHSDLIAPSTSNMQMRFDTAEAPPIKLYAGIEHLFLSVLSYPEALTSKVLFATKQERIRIATALFSILGATHPEIDDINSRLFDL